MAPTSTGPAAATAQSRVAVLRAAALTVLTAMLSLDLFSAK